MEQFTASWNSSLSYGTVNGAMEQLTALRNSSQRYDTVYRWQVTELSDPLSNSTVGFIVPTEKFRSDLGFLTFLVVTNILCQYIPANILLVANLGLLVYLVLHKKRIREQDIRGTATNQNRVRPVRSVSIVFAYSVVTLALNLPLEIYMSRDVYSEIESWGTDELPEHQDIGLIPFIYSCVNVLSWSVNFFIYCVIHTVDSVIHTVDSVIHTVDSVIYTVDSVIYTMDSVIHTVDSVIHTVDSVIHTVDNVIHTVDSVIHTVDSVIHTVDSVIHTVDSVIYTVGLADLQGNIICEMESS
ncbi:hypothetical protein ACOMHN_042849 [Nucella lapillus]